MRSGQYIKIYLLGILVLIGIISAEGVVNRQQTTGPTSVRPVVLRQGKPCVPRPAGATASVGGLRANLPQLPMALRLNYAGEGTSQYTARADGRQVMNYYLSELAADCWTLTALQTDNAEWHRGTEGVRIAVAARALGAKAIVNYQELGRRVLGVSTIADTTCPSGQIYCAAPNGGSGGCYSGASCPTPTAYPAGSTSTCPAAPAGCSGSFTYDTNGCPTGCATTTYTPPSPTPSPTPGTSGTACGTGQYWCNGGCVANGTACSWPSPSTTSCPSGQIYCPPLGNGTPGGCYSGSCPTIGSGSSGGMPTDESSCTSQGKVWCTGSGGSTSGWCQYQGPCPSTTGGTGSTCGSGQYWCNGACIPNGTTCGGSWSAPPSCPSTQYFCNNTCIPNGTSCNNYPYYSPGGGSTPTCGSSAYYCASQNQCVPNGTTCGAPSGTPSPGSTPAGWREIIWNNLGLRSYVSVNAPQSVIDAAKAACANTRPDQVTWPNSSDFSRSESAGVPSCPGGSNQPVPTLGQPSANAQPPIPPTQPFSQQPQTPPSQTQPSPTPPSLTQPSTPSDTVQTREPSHPAGQNTAQGNELSSGPQIDDRRFQDMKQGLSQFVRGVESMKKMVNRLNRQFNGAVVIPPELTAALEKAPAIVEKIKAAKSPDELEDTIDDVQDIGQTLQEWGPKLGELTRLWQMLKQSTRDVRNLQRSLKRAQSLARTKVDLKDAVNDLTTLFGEMNRALTDAQTLAKTDPESALDKLEDDYYGRMEEFWNQVSLIDTLRNVQQGLSKAASEVRRAALAVDRLAKSGKLSPTVVAELKDLIANLKGKIVELKSLAAQKNTSRDDLASAIEDLWQQFIEFQNRAAAVGLNFYLPTVGSGPNVPVDLPQSFLSGTTSTATPQPLSSTP